MFQRPLTNGFRDRRILCDGDAFDHEAVKYCHIEQHLTESKRASENSKEGCVADIHTNDDDPGGCDIEEDADSNDDDQILIEIS